MPVGYEVPSLGAVARTRPAFASAGALRRAASIPAEEAWGLWSEVLSDSGPVLLGLLDEWHGYTGLGYRELLATALGAEERTHDDWQAMRPETPADVAAFYDRSASWLPILLWWHGTERGSNSPARAAAAAARVFDAIGARRILDFGCGVGSTALFLAERGFEVVAADVSRESLRFAEWRLRRRGHDPEIEYLRERGVGDLPPGSVDGIVVFDVLEHVHHEDLADTIRGLSAALAPGGAICLNQVFVEEEEIGHFPLRGEPLWLLHAEGFRLTHVPGLFWIAQKVPQGAPARLRQRASLAARIRAATAARRWRGPIGRRIAWRVVRYGMS